MKARFSVLLLALASASWLAPGCSSGGGHAPLRIELAPTIACNTASADFPGDLRFFTIQICAAGTSDCVPLQDPSGDHAGGSTQLRVARTLDRRFTLDARLDPSMDYDVTVTGYSGAETGTCTPYAVGHSLDVRFGRDDVQVRLYPIGSWSCAGIHEGTADPVPRALHQAVLLPNHEVLILGGVSGPHPGAVTFSMPSFAQRSVEVFDPRDSRFHPVTMNDEDGKPGFSRVMFEARYVRTNEMGQYEIHTYGGFDIESVADGGLGFDANAIATPQSALFGPVSPMMMGVAGGFRSDTIILYDPLTRTASLTPHMVGNYTVSAASDASGTIAVVHGIDSVMINASRVPTTFGLSAAWYVDGGAAGTLMADRLGATVTAISANNFLIWGGHVANATGMPLTTTMPSQVITLAGEVVSTTPMSIDNRVSGHDPMVTPDDNAPLPTAYHTATHVAGPAGSTSILFTGGAMVRGSTSPLAGAPFASPSMTITRFGADGSILGAYRFNDRISTILHTASPVDASATNVLVVGGASEMMVSGTLTTLFGETVTGLVRYSASANTYSWVPLPNLVAGRWGHTTTIIPNHGVLVVGGLTRADSLLTVQDSSEFLLWEDLTSSGAPHSMDCAMATDAGMPVDAGRASDSGPAAAPDANVDANRPDTGVPSVDAGGGNG